MARYGFTKEEAKKFRAILEVLEREEMEADVDTINFEMKMCTLVATEPTHGTEGNVYYKTKEGYLIV